MSGKTIKMPSVGKLKEHETQEVTLEQLDHQLMEADNLRDAFCNMLQHEIENVNKMYDDASNALKMLQNNVNAGNVLAPEFEKVHLNIFMGAMSQLKSTCIANLNGNAIQMLNMMSKPE